MAKILKAKKGYTTRGDGDYTDDSDSDNDIPKEDSTEDSSDRPQTPCSDLETAPIVVQQKSALPLNKSCNILYVAGLFPDRTELTKEALEEHFKKYGNVVQVDINEEKRYAKIQFDCDDSVEKCVQLGHVVIKSHRCDVKNWIKTRKFIPRILHRFQPNDQPIKELKQKEQHHRATGANREALFDVNEVRVRLRSLIDKEGFSTSTPWHQAFHDHSINSTLLPESRRLDSGYEPSLLQQEKHSIFNALYPLVEPTDKVTKILAVRIMDTVRGKNGHDMPYYQYLVQCADGHTAKAFTSTLMKAEPFLVAAVYERMLADIISGRFSFDTNEEYDVITNNSATLDGFFIFSLIRDVCEGLVYIHNSFLACHGFLKSSYCLIDDRWQVKISNYGIKKFRNLENRKAKELLWTAPELIRENNHVGTKQGDIYSFAIICSEIINMKPAFDATDQGTNPEEIVYLVKKGGPRPLRPTLQPVIQEINPALLHLVRDCWSENSSDRPRAETIRSLLKSMVAGRSANLMDHVFNMLEQYAGSLEEEVEERTKELVEEKKKSDILLYRMLPKQVADKLKVGHSVEPETFESVTVFFSDVVSFTTLASRCTPLQVVNLLNDLYTVFDGIIGEYDVYKVETIGDGYLCVSGLPHRNGNDHSRHIANMALGFIKSLDRFTIPHLPGEKISLRIGLHTGSCVAGVVGLAMPRYCLFGDTVNTASRMESNGKPNRIHISSETNRYLTQIIGGYITESRGEVIIKGKGVMETFWLLGHVDDVKTPTPPNNE